MAASTQVADHALDVAAVVTDLGVLGRFDFDERCPGEVGQSTGDLGFADAGRADHDDVLGRDLPPHLGESCFQRQRFRNAMATDRLASSCPMMCSSSRSTTCRGVSSAMGELMG